MLNYRFTYASNGQQVVYKNWASGEPNNWKSSNNKEGEDCVQSITSPGHWNGRWNDVRCDDRSAVVCERSSKFCIAF